MLFNPGRLWWWREPRRVHLRIQLPLPPQSAKGAKVGETDFSLNSQVSHCGRPPKVESLQVFGKVLSCSLLAAPPGSHFSRSWTTRSSPSPPAAATRPQGAKFLAQLSPVTSKNLVKLIHLKIRFFCKNLKIWGDRLSFTSHPECHELSRAMNWTQGLPITTSVVKILKNVSQGVLEFF